MTCVKRTLPPFRPGLGLAIFFLALAVIDVRHVIVLVGDDVSLAVLKFGGDPAPFTLLPNLLLPSDTFREAAKSGDQDGHLLASLDPAKLRSASRIPTATHGSSSPRPSIA